MRLNKTVPKITSDELVPLKIREFKRAVRVFLAQNDAAFPVGLLCDRNLQEEIEEDTGKDIEDVTEDEVFTFLQKEAVPKSLEALKEALEKIECQTTDATRDRTSCVRQFTAQFKEFAGLAQKVAERELLSTGLSQLVPPVTEKQAFINAKGTAEVRDHQRPANHTEVAAERVKGFQKTITKVYMRRLKSKSFFLRVNLERINLNVKSLDDLITLTRAIAKHEDAQGTIVDEAVTTTPNKTAATGTGETPTASVTDTGEKKRDGPKKKTPSDTGSSQGRWRNCRHCGGAHWDSDCPKHQEATDPKPEQKVYSRDNGSLRAKPTPKVQANTAQADEDEILTAQALINGKEYSVVVDTGAGKSFISSRTLHNLKEVDNVRTSPAPALNVVQADGSVTKCNERVTLTLTIPKLAKIPVRFEQAFYVIPGGTHKILLGCGALRSLGLLTDDQLSLTFTENEKTGEDPLPYPHEYLNNVSSADDAGFEGVDIPKSSGSAIFRQIVERYKAVFDPNLPEEGSRLEPMTIELTDETVPIHQRARPLNPTKREQVREEVEKLRKQGFVRDSQGPFSSPVVVVSGGHKGSKKIRLCVDYKALNAKTVGDKYPMPDVRRFVRNAAGSKYFATLDLRQGYYYQLRMDPTDIPKTAFVTPDDYAEFTRCPFGLRNAPARFQRAMDQAFRVVLHRGVAIYLDDIFVYGATKKEFAARLEATLKICADMGLRLKASKCTIGAREVEVVGYVINDKGMSLSHERIQGIDDLARPATKKKLERVLGSFNYVSKFVPDTSRLLRPLNELRQKDSDGVWQDKHQSAFDGFKAAVADHLTLSFPDLSKPWVLHTDASEAGYGGVLYQKAEAGWEIVSFFSGSFDKTQQKWSTYEQELWGIIACLTRPDMAPLFRIHEDLHVQTDHRNLIIYMFQKRDMNNKLLRWSLVLQDFSFTIDHIPGRQNVVADQLSRASCNTATITHDWPARILEAQKAAPAEERARWEQYDRLPDGLWTREGVPIVPQEAADGVGTAPSAANTSVPPPVQRGG